MYNTVDEAQARQKRDGGWDGFDTARLFAEEGGAESRISREGYDHCYPREGMC